MRKLFTLVSVAIAMLLSALAVPVAVADPYEPIPRPLCTIRVIDGDPGERVVIEVGARINAETQPSGTIRIRLDEGVGQPGGVWTRTVRISGEPERILGPVVPAGTHLITTRFVPDNPMDSSGCQGEQLFDLAGDDDEDDDDNGGGDNGGGLLPDTGGPDMLWLLVGLVLLASGGAIVVYSRRRAQVPAH